MVAHLPIDDVLPEIVSVLTAGPNLVLAAPPGAGKTTRVPPALLDAPWADGRILMLEPRRIAAREAAARIAAERGERLGETVGYRIRDDVVSGPDTRLEVITEGILTRMLQGDPELSGVSAVIFDEVHERSIHTDLGLALCLECQDVLRPDLRLVAMSATAETEAFARLMGGCPIVASEGRMFPVETVWLETPWRPRDRRGGGAEARAFASAAVDLVQKALSDGTGDVLVFLPGAGEIRRVAAALDGCTGGAVVAQLYGALDLRAQRAALASDPDGRRRVVLATAIAETSLTVPGVRAVVDTGLARRSATDPATGMSRLVTERVTRTEADQRRGRAGRVAEGRCYRMWTRGEESGLAPFPPPEILRTDIVPLALELAAWGAGDGANLAFLNPPPQSAMASARALLQALGALDAGGGVTRHGERLARLPVHPRLGHMLETARRDGLGAEAALVAALVSARGPLGGHGTDLWEAARATLGDRGDADRGTLATIRREAKRLDRGRASHDRLSRTIGRLAALAYPDRIGQRRRGDAPRYRLANGRGAVLAEASSQAGDRYLVVTDLEDGREARIRTAATLSETDLRETFTAQIVRAPHIAWNDRTAQVDAVERESFGHLVLSEQKLTAPSPEAIAAALADGVAQRGASVLPWSRHANALRARMRWLAEVGAPDEGWPDWSDDALTLSVRDWLAPHLGTRTRLPQIETLDLAEVLLATLDWPLREALDRLAPRRIALPSGQSLAVRYEGDVPMVSARVQVFYGLTEHPALGPRRIPVLVEMLSPAERPVQRTRDVPGFWTSSWADVRKDMRARYPRHDWPDDPASASPSARPQRRR